MPTVSGPETRRLKAFADLYRRNPAEFPLEGREPRYTELLRLSYPSSQPRRFFGSVEIDMVRPVKAFDAILNAVVMELQRSRGAKVKLKLENEADAEDGFSEADIGSSATTLAN